MNVETLKQMQQDPAIQAAAAAVFTLMAREQVIREIVEPMHDEVLKFFKFQLSPDWIDRFKRRNEPIPEYLDRKNDYLMSDEDMTIYCKELHTRLVAAGLKKDSEEVGRCPLLCAESDTRDAKRLMTDLTTEYTGLTFDLLICKSLESYKQYIELILNLMAGTSKDKATEIVAAAAQRRATK